MTRTPRSLALWTGVCILLLIGSATLPGDRLGAGVDVLAAQQQNRPSEGRGPGGPGGPGSAWDWWNDGDVRKEIGLSPEKAKRINDIYQRRADQQKALVEEWQVQSAELQKITKAALVDEGTYAVQVLRVESLQSRLRESRTVLLYSIFRLLDPDQQKKLQAVFDRRSANFDRGRQSH